MKKYIYYIATVALGAMTLNSCNFLEVEDKSAGGQTAEQFFGGDATSLGIYAYSLSSSLFFLNSERTMPSNARELVRQSSNASSSV